MSEAGKALMSGSFVSFDEVRYHVDGVFEGCEPLGGATLESDAALLNDRKRVSRHESQARIATRRRIMKPSPGSATLMPSRPANLLFGVTSLSRVRVA